ncbi:unnamed protein product [Adineta steineri]|uniref:Uncharacterized protein n=1 Tax=Adineta steineri TaxID=433720 RepID=A0A819GEZ0_9BILA|nr:unnamed protein product [Adineta steineri]CAF4000690.1 unnamed protein product [Adineta steineri]
MSTMNNNNNRIGVVDDSETITSNGTQSETSCEYLKKRKVTWIIFTIIVLVIIMTLLILIFKSEKTSSGKTSTTEEITIKITEKMDVTTGSENETIIYFEVNIR